jgi:ABC-2 type transport system permease protein
MSALLTCRVELRQAWRDGRARASLFALLALAVMTLAIGWQQQARHEQDVRQAAASDRRIWEGQGARNPHSVAHFGQYAFKPAGALAAFDPGLTPWQGTALWMEAHSQNTATYRPAEDEGDPPVLATLSGAFVMQTLAPLALVFLGFGLVARERERQTLRLALASGARAVTWVAGKFLALAAVAVVLWLPAWLPVGAADTADARSRAVLLALAYGVFLLTICALVIAVSARARTAHGALLMLLGGWVVLSLVLPRLGAALADGVAPSTDAGQFWREVRAALEEGIDGHSSAGAREEALLQETLRRHGVARAEDLPISFAGISLQAGEEHGNEVYDHFHGRLQQEESRQRTVLRGASLLTPWIAIRGLSSGLSGTDSVHHWHFVHAAERYRRELQRFLNGDFTQNAGRLEFDYQADPRLWRTTPVFSYQAPGLADVARAYLGEALLLLGWAAIALLAMLSAARSLDREGASS